MGAQCTGQPSMLDGAFGVHCGWRHVTSRLSPHACHFTPVTSRLAPRACHLTPVTSRLSLHACHFAQKTRAKADNPFWSTPPSPPAQPRPPAVRPTDRGNLLAEGACTRPTNRHGALVHDGVLHVVGWSSRPRLSLLAAAAASHTTHPPHSIDAATSTSAFSTVSSQPRSRIYSIHNQLPSYSRSRSPSSSSRDISHTLTLHHMTRLSLRATHFFFPFVTARHARPNTTAAYTGHTWQHSFIPFLHMNTPQLSLRSSTFHHHGHTFIRTHSSPSSLPTATTLVCPHDGVHPS